LSSFNLFKLGEEISSRRNFGVKTLGCGNVKTIT